MRSEKVYFKIKNLAFLGALNWCIICCASALSSCLSLDDVLTRSRSSCVVALVTKNCIADQDVDNYGYVQLRNLFQHKNLGIVVDFVHIDSKWPNGEPLRKGNVEVGNIVLFRKVKKDRTCLLPSTREQSIVPVILNGINDLATLVDFVNDGCETYFSTSGGPSVEGLHRNEILKTLFHVKNISNIQSRKVFPTQSPQFCEVKDQSCSDTNHMLHSNPSKIPECEKIDLPSKNSFFHNYVKTSKPVIFKNVLRNWPAFSKWTNSYLREKYGKNNIHIKLTPLGEYEGVEPRNMWENHEKFKIPQSVLNQLAFPDLVVVRPATKNLNFSSFMDIVEKVSNGSIKDMSAYLEYSSIPDHLPELEDDIQEDLFFQGLLKRDHLNIWLSDGRTLGKLHFDQYDNLLCQVNFPFKYLYSIYTIFLTQKHEMKKALISFFIIIFLFQES